MSSKAKFLTAILIFAGSVYLNGGKKINYEELKTGDLIFQVEGVSDFSKAISSATGFNDSVKVVHVGIIDVNAKGIEVIEASPEEGVKDVCLKEFIREGTPYKEGEIRFIVKRLQQDLPFKEIAIKARRHIGEPYDWCYLPDNGKMYCSELIQSVYIDSLGRNIFPVKPMNFKDSAGNIPQFWVDLFRKLEMEVPQDMPGTNPQDMFNNPILEEVCRF